MSRKSRLESTSDVMRVDDALESVVDDAAVCRLAPLSDNIA